VYLVDKVSTILGVDSDLVRREKQARKFRSRLGHPDLFDCISDGKFVDVKIR
jgi:predicted nucleotidyltransferase